MNTRATSTGFVVIRDISTGFVDGAGISQTFFVVECHEYKGYFNWFC